MATYQEQIDAINAILARGLEEVVDQDGRKHRYDLAALTKQRDYLIKQSRGSGPSLRRGVYNPRFGQDAY